MIEISIGNIKDNLIAKRITDYEINIANSAIKNLARRLGVTEYTDVDENVLMYASAYACYYFCLHNAGTDPMFNAEGENDVFITKLKIYKAETERLQAIITAKNFGAEEGRALNSVPLYRA